MSRVFSFRLNHNNPSDAKMLEVIYLYEERGFSIRQIVIEGLKKLSEVADVSYADEFRMINKKLDHLLTALPDLQEVKGQNYDSEYQGSSHKNIPSEMISALKRTIKPGLSLGSKGFQEDQ